MKSGINKGGREGETPVAAHIGILMMGLGMVGAALALAYPILALFLDEVFEIQWPSYGALGSIFLACMGFSVAVAGGLMSEKALGRRRRDKAEGDGDNGD